MNRLFIILLTICGVCTATNIEAKSRIALVQCSFGWGDTERNTAAAEQKIESIDGCDLIIFPELFLSGCDMQKRDKQLKIADKKRIAQQYQPTIERMKEWAKKSGAVIVGSTIYQQNELFYNRLLAVYPSGKVLHYDKHNCFRMGSFSPGTEHVVIEVNSHRYATYICYDLRFAEWSRNNGRYDSAIYIANWSDTTAEAWNSLLKERAIENRAHVIGVNCVGKDPGGVTFMGDSSVYTPDGEILGRCRSNEEQILIVEY